jgi:hypothetical protein
LKENYKYKRPYCVLVSVLKSQSELRTESIETNKTLIRPVATDGAGSWTLYKDIAKRLLLLKVKPSEECFIELK